MLTSKSIEQILAVLTRIRARCLRHDSIKKAYQGAVYETSKNYDVTYQTIGDLCRRRLGLKNIDQFHGLLEKWIAGNAEPLMSVLISKTASRNHYKIRDYFGRKNHEFVVENTRPPGSEEESFTIRLPRDIAKRLKVLSLMSGDSLPKWLSEVVTQVVEQRYKEWLATQIKREAT